MKLVDQIARYTFVYSIFATLSKLDTWERTSSFLSARFDEFQQIIIFIGRTAHILVLPWEEFSRIVFSIFPFSTPEHWQDPILIASIGAISPFFVMCKYLETITSKNLVITISKLRKLIHCTDDSSLDDLKKFFKNYYFSMFFLSSSVVRYLRIIDFDAPQDILLRRKLAAAEELSLMQNSLYSDYLQTANSFRKCLKRHAMRFAIMSSVFFVIAIDLIYTGYNLEFLSIAWRTVLLIFLAAILSGLILIILSVILNMLPNLWYFWERTFGGRNSRETISKIIDIALKGTAQFGAELSAMNNNSFYSNIYIGQYNVNLDLSPDLGPRQAGIFRFEIG